MIDKDKEDEKNLVVIALSGVIYILFIIWIIGFCIVVCVPTIAKSEERKVVTVQIIHPSSKYSEKRAWVIKVFRIVKSRLEEKFPELDIKLGQYKPVKMRSSWYFKPDYTLQNSISSEVDRLLTLFEGYLAKYEDPYGLHWFLLPSVLATTAGGANGVCIYDNHRWKSALFSIGKKWTNTIRVHLNEPAIGAALHEFGHAFGALHTVLLSEKDSIMSVNAGQGNRFFNGEFIPDYSATSIQQIRSCLWRNE